jgi:DNA helicase MCM8
VACPFPQPSGTRLGRVADGAGGGGTGHNKQAKTMYVMYIDANAVTNLCVLAPNGCPRPAHLMPGELWHSKSRAAQTGEGTETVQYSLKDMYMIQDLAHQPHLFRLLVRSLCPPILGHELVKGPSTPPPPYGCTEGPS